MSNIVANNHDFSLGPSPAAWQLALKRAIRQPAELLRLLELPASLAPKLETSPHPFPLRVPRGFVARMKPGDPDDPLFRQVWPLDEEHRPVDGFTADPVGDTAATVGPGLLHKYEGRALLVATGACAVHCRYCFRRHFPYEDSPPNRAAWQQAVQAIAGDESLTEVILSGGDPLSLVDEQLAWLVARLAEIPHLRRLRVHSRWPVVIPERVDDGLLGWLTGTRLTPVMVIHANHAQELDSTVSAAMNRLHRAGVLLLNQSVLLRGVNDNVPALAALSEALIDLRVTPYYLHQLDRVTGAAHFEVPASHGLELLSQLHSILPGYAVPRYVQEIPGACGKLPVSTLTFAAV